MKALVTGASGQLGRALVAARPRGWVVRGLDRAALDLTDAEAVARMIAHERPDLVINAAAYTAVDRAESEAELAEMINARAVAHFAAATKRIGARLVQISTDFVFDGRAAHPYPADAPTAPLNVYGRTKLAGEVAAGADALIVRTAWVHAAQGSNFVHTMLRLMREHDAVRVVHDQIGSPTHAVGLARAIWTLSEKEARGTFHYTDCGVASWYDFAMAIQEEALAIDLLDREVPIIPIPASTFPTAAMRPPFSVLDKEPTWQALGWCAPHWRVALRAMLQELLENG